MIKLNSVRWWIFFVFVLDLKNNLFVVEESIVFMYIKVFNKLVEVLMCLGEVWK